MPPRCSPIPSARPRACAPSSRCTASMRDLTRDASFLSINTATLKTLTLRQAVETLARHDIRAIAPWRDRLAECGVKDAARLLADHGMTVTGLCRGGMFTSGDDARDDNRRAVDEAAAIGAQCLVLVVGGLAAGSPRNCNPRKKGREGNAPPLPHTRAGGAQVGLWPG